MHVHLVKIRQLNSDGPDLTRGSTKRLERALRWGEEASWHAVTPHRAWHSSFLLHATDESYQQLSRSQY